MKPHAVELFDYAVGCAANGWVAIPRRGKRPVLRDWTDLSAEDLSDDDFRDMPWSGADGAFLVMAPGSVALDVDDLELFRSRGHEVPDAPGQDTPSGGLHRLLRGNVPQVGLKTIEGYDTRAGGRGGIAVYDLSMMPPRVSKLPPAPDWLTRVGRQPLDLGSEEAESFGEGERDEALTRACGQMVNIGMTANERLAALLVMNRDRCDPALSRAQVEKIVRSSVSWDRAPGLPVIRFRRGSRRRGSR